MYSLFDVKSTNVDEYYSVREVLEILVTPLPPSKLKKFGEFISDLWKFITKQSPMKDTERPSYFIEEEKPCSFLVNVYPKFWLESIIISSIKFCPDFFYAE
tara:strand:- start:89 stop:391 length:303 start_codon:yes stop_codon:yes gene_type:complete